MDGSPTLRPWFQSTDLERSSSSRSSLSEPTRVREGQSQATPSTTRRHHKRVHGIAGHVIQPTPTIRRNTKRAKRHNATLARRGSAGGREVGCVRNDELACTKCGWGLPSAALSFAQRAAVPASGDLTLLDIIVIIRLGKLFCIDEAVDARHGRWSRPRSNDPRSCTNGCDNPNPIRATAGLSRGRRGKVGSYCTVYTYRTASEHESDDWLDSVSKSQCLELKSVAAAMQFVIIFQPDGETQPRGPAGVKFEANGAPCTHTHAHARPRARTHTHTHAHTRTHTHSACRFGRDNVVSDMQDDQERDGCCQVVEAVARITRTRLLSTIARQPRQERLLRVGAV